MMAENVAREFAEKGAARAKDAYGKAQATADQATKVIEQTYSAASKGAAASALPTFRDRAIIRTIGHIHSFNCNNSTAAGEGNGGWGPPSGRLICWS
jgi:hypothetical protein